MPNKAPSAPHKGDTREFWKQHSIAVDTTKLKERIKETAKSIADDARSAGEHDARGRKDIGNSDMSRARNKMNKLVAQQDSLESIRRKGRKK